MKKLFPFICLILSVLFFSCSSQKISLQQTSGFKSPQDIVNYLIMNIKTGNFDNTLKTSVFFYDNIIEKLDAKELAKQQFIIHPFNNLNSPKEYHSITKARFLGQHASYIQMFVSSLLLPQEFNDFLEGEPISLLPSSPINEKLLDAYFSSLSNLSDLESLELIRMDITLPKYQFDADFKQTSELGKLIYKYDEIIDYTVLFKMNNKYYSGGYLFFRYGSDWYIANYRSIFGETSAYGSVNLVSGIQEYLSIFHLE